eukprot:1784877-Prymnesium_polylepis.1
MQHLAVGAPQMRQSVAPRPDTVEDGGPSPGHQHVALHLVDRVDEVARPDLGWVPEGSRRRVKSRAGRVGAGVAQFRCERMHEHRHCGDCSIHFQIHGPWDLSQALVSATGHGG